ncbi:MAG: UDP-N-acetylmuramoyl-L-alanine--D-glutamate ligase [Ignavibacteriaceae bacterium]|nr:UDP-N-acetylmuramoyl-L-alanine--D-glutamate ligase [Ignavibacteriaceae bacterium]
MDILKKKISVIGAARSGIGAARLIRKMGGIPFVSDISDEIKLAESVNILKSENFDYEITGHTEKVFNADLIVVSPGVPSDSDILKKAAEKNIKIVSEIELASSFCKGNIIAITGTNGKTTTTSLCGYLFNECGANAYLAGNIGHAFSEITESVKQNEFVSLEVSSFQLDFIDRFKPKVAMILNITPDHLNRYDNKYEYYAGAKLRIFENQDANDFIILNRDNEGVNQFVKNYKSNAFFFSLTQKESNGCYVEDNKVFFSRNNNVEFICSVDDIYLRGEHNLANAMAVIIAAKIFNLNNSGIINALRSFKGVEHRLELVREIEQVKYVNDSKATNVDSVWYALRSFKEPLFLILGGQDKGNDYNQIKDLVIEKVVKIYAIGSSADKVFNFFHRFVKVEIKDSLEDAVTAASKEARAGDVVLLSPACASFDMFNNYEHRGKVFKEAVNSL